MLMVINVNINININIIQLTGELSLELVSIHTLYCALFTVHSIADTPRCGSNEVLRRPGRPAILGIAPPHLGRALHATGRRGLYPPPSTKASLQLLYINVRALVWALAHLSSACVSVWLQKCDVCSSFIRAPSNGRWQGRG